MSEKSKKKWENCERNGVITLHWRMHEENHENQYFLESMMAYHFIYKFIPFTCFFPYLFISSVGIILVIEMKRKKKLPPFYILSKVE